MQSCERSNLRHPPPPPPQKPFVPPSLYSIISAGDWAIYTIKAFLFYPRSFPLSSKILLISDSMSCLIFQTSRWPFHRTNKVLKTRVLSRCERQHSASSRAHAEASVPPTSSGAREGGALWCPWTLCTGSVLVLQDCPATVPLKTNLCIPSFQVWPFFIFRLFIVITFYLFIFGFNRIHF